MLDGEPVQLIAPELRLPLPVVDLTDLPEAARENRGPATARRKKSTGPSIWRRPAHAGDSAAAGGRRSRPDPEYAPRHQRRLVDGCVVAGTGCALRGVCRWSTFAAAGAAGPVRRLRSLARELLAGETLDKQLTYWKQHLAALPPALELPTDHPRPPCRRYRGATEASTLAEGLTGSLAAARAAARARRCS